MTRTTTTVTTSSAGGRQRRGTRRRAALTTLALAAGLGLLAAAPAAADTTTYADSVGDVGGSNHLPTLDILRYRLSLDASDFSLTVWSRATAADPIPGDARLAVDLAVDGDFRTSFQLRPTSASTWDVYAGGPVSSDRVCSAAGGVGIDTMTVTVPASCLGSPGKVAAKIDLSSTDGESFDRAPVQFLPLSGVLGIPVYFSPPVTAGPDLNPTTTPLVSVYRFWSPGFNNAHFFTTDEDEAVNIRAFDPNWRYEGRAFSAILGDESTCEEGSPVFRFWSSAFQSHFYTQRVSEKDEIVANDRNWTYEGVAYCAYPTESAGSVPLYRFWSPGFRKHFFTADQAEADHIRAVDRNWQDEGIAYYVLPDS